MLVVTAAVVAAAVVVRVVVFGVWLRGATKTTGCDR